MDIKDFVPLPDLESFKHILAIQPHPDDNEIGAGATLAKLSSLGVRISYLTVSKGKGGSNTLSSKELIEIRQKELVEAGKTVGASYFEQFDLEDSHYPDEKALTEKMVEVIRKLQPDCVMTVDPYLMYEAHPTHRKVGMAALEACLFSSMKHFPIPDQNNHETKSVKAIAFYASAHPNTYVDVSDTFDIKLKAIACHQSQFDEKALVQLRQYLSFQALKLGQRKEGSFFESFKVLPLVLTHMMVESETY
jgi:N,N'-diacetylchitobiose non-reducing end deacetylase